MVTPEDMMMASKLVTVSPGYLSKWTKAELTSAVLALKLFVHELPGGPKLLHRAADLATSSTGREDERMLRAVEAIRCQEGVDASLYRPAQSAATSTQKLNGMGLSWADISASQIPSGQGDGSNIPSRSNGSSSSSGSVSVDPNGKVSDHSSSSVLSLAAPVQLPHGPHNGASVGGDGGVVVDVGTNGSGVAGVGGVDDVSDTGNMNARGATATRTRVCNRVWVGKICKKEISGCRFAHPTLCKSNNCGGACGAFHPPGNGIGGVRKGSGASTRKKPNAGGRSRGGSSGTGSSSKSSSGNRNNSSNKRGALPSYAQLQAKVAALELKRSRDREREVKRELKELKGTTATNITNGGSSSGWWARLNSSIAGGVEGSAHAQLPPGLMDAVVTAVLAVMADKGMVQGGQRELRHCRC